jgi:Ca2+-binding RTX toxin-like protein
MPIFALYNFNDLGSVVADSALGNGAQDGVYLDGAAPVGGQAVLDGINDQVKIFHNPEFQLVAGTLEIEFSQTSHIGAESNTVLSRDSVGENAGGFRIEVTPDGTVLISHESVGDTTTFQTEAGFVNPGDDINVSYSWDVTNGGAVQITNLTTDDSFADDVPAGLTMDQDPINQDWFIGSDQSESDPAILNNLGNYFNGTVEVFSLSDTVDNLGDDDPTANPDDAETAEDTSVIIPVLDNDRDPNGDLLTIDGTPTAENGTVAVNDDGTLTYTPNDNFNGPGTISYTVRDPAGNTASSTVAVTVTPVNDAPVAGDDAATTALNTAVIIPVLVNDSDVDNDTLSIVGTPTSPNGTVAVNDDGTITFTPTTDFEGPTTISYTVTDPDGLTDTATVDVTVGDVDRDGFVDGTGAGELIDEDFAGDPDGDFVDNEDALLPGAAPNDDVIRAGGGDDTVIAGLGDDRVTAGPGEDIVFGGVGDDTLFGGADNDVLNGEEGSDYIQGNDGDDIITSDTGLQLPDLAFPGLFTADADPFDNLDTVFGGAGNDTISTGDDADLIYGGTGDDLIDGGVDADTIIAGQGNDTIIGGEGSDFIQGNLGDDLIFGGLGPEFPDSLNIPDASGDPVTNNGADLIQGGGGNDTIYGLDDNDVISGNSGDDEIFGGVDQDRIFGGTGNDTITGGEGADVASGGADRDVFLVGSQGDGIGDRINGNEGGDDFDTLDLRGAGPLRVDFSDDNPENGTVNFFDADGNTTGTLDFVNIENVVPCFTPGTLIATPKGEVPVESLKAGDKVITRDNGIQEIRWTGKKGLDWAALTANPYLRPVLIRRGSLGNGLPERDMMVSPNHRVLVANDRTALYFDEHEVLVAAKHLVGAKGILNVESIGTSYLHFMFDQHEVVLSDGAWTESFQPGDYSLKGMGNAQRAEIFELFPDLKSEAGREGYGAARRTLKKHEAVLLTR